MTITARSFQRGAPWVWAALSILCWFASLILTLPIAAAAPEFGGLRSDLALLLAINGGVSLVAVQLIGGALLSRPLARPGTKLMLPLAGILLAIAVELALHEWAEARYGYYDSELIWWTAGLSPMLILTAVASFGVLVAPSGAVAPPLVGLSLAVAGVLFIVLSNVAGLGDGIDPESWPLATLVGASAAYSLGAVAVCVRRASARGTLRGTDSIVAS